MANLLERASIVLTPTGFNNGEALCVKPDDGSGDFDFSRNSAATRVNAQGLVEDVQILSSNLVQNGDFSEEGAEEVSNGSFSQEGVEIADNSTITNAGTAIMTQLSPLNYNATSEGGESTIRPRLFFNDVVQDNFYRIRVSGTNQSGTVNFKLYNGSEYVIEGNDLTTDIDLYFKAEGTNVFVVFDSSNAFNVDFTISLVEVGQDWVFGTGWSVGENKAIYDNSGSSTLIQNFTWQVGKTYKVTFDVGDFTTSQRFDIYSGVSFIKTATIDSNTSYTIYFNGDGGSTFRFRGLTTESFSITNISVKEVGQNWDLNDWSVGDSLASSGNTSSLLRQDNIFTSTTSIYKTTFKAKSVNGSSVTLRVYDGSGNNFETITITSSDFQDFELTRQRQGASASLFFFNNSNAEIEVTNISVIEITDDTNLPRINYEGFSYQDALGSEEVVNGDFSNGTTGWILPEGWSIANGKASYDGLNGTKQIVCSAGPSATIGNTYKVTFDVLEQGVGANSAFYGGVLFSSANLLVGSYAFYVTATSTGRFGIFGRDGGIFSIDNVSVKEYLGQEVVPDSGCGSWLFEPQSTNFVTQSELFSGWSQTAISVFSNNIASPSGEINATRIVESFTNSVHSLSLGGVTTGNQYTISVFAKAEERSIISFGGLGLYSNNEFVQYDLINGTATNTGTTNNASVSIENYGNGWYRCIATYTATGSSGLVIAMLDQLYTGNSGSGSGQTYQGDGVSGLYIWGAQLEQQSYATSYIPTSGTSVTRNQDVCTNGGSVSTINSTEGTLYFEGNVLANTSTFEVISLSDGSTSNILALVYRNIANQFTGVVKSGGSTSLSKTITLADATSTIKAAISYKLNDFKFYVNGVLIIADTTGNTPIGLNTLHFADGNGTSNKFFGKNKCLAVWKEALSDEELTLLTTI